MAKRIFFSRRAIFDDTFSILIFVVLFVIVLIVINGFKSHKINSINHELDENKEKTIAMDDLLVFLDSPVSPDNETTVADLVAYSSATNDFSKLSVITSQYFNRLYLSQTQSWQISISDLNGKITNDIRGRNYLISTNKDVVASAMIPNYFNKENPITIKLFVGKGISTLLPISSIDS